MRLADAPWLPALAGAFIPALLWLRVFYRRDRYEPEPKRLIVGFFLLGIVAVAPAIAGNELFAIATGFGGGLLATTVGAPLVEEPVKAGLGVLGSRRTAELDEPVDAMIYFTTIGLGFGALETAFYTIAAYLGAGAGALGGAGVDATGAAVTISVFRAVTTTVGHGIWTGLAGYFVGRRRFDASARSPWFGLALAMLAHAAWNWFADANLATAVGALVVSGIVYLALIERALAVSPYRRRLGGGRSG